ncbi:MAG: tubulin-like doman-containing protein [Anaerolineae bacterium]
MNGVNFNRNDGHSPRPNDNPFGQRGQTATGGVAMMQTIAEVSMVRPVVAAARLAETTADGQTGRGPTRLEQPLLVLAVGGSARQVATRLKAAFIERFGRLPENVVILCFDSADEPIAVREGRHGRIVALEERSEFHLLERVPVAGIKRAPHYHAAFVGRLGANLGRIRRASIGDGCAQERPQGLAALVWNAPRVMRLIENAIRRLIERSDDLNRDAGERGGLSVVLIGSAPGGQGSGALHDLAQLTHAALRKVGDLEETSRFLGIVLLPGAFPDVRGPKLAPNTHAFFRELDAVMQGAAFQAVYPGNISVANQEPPLDVVFVLDGIDERGRAFANLDEVCDLAAQSLAVLLGSEVGMREIFAAVNEQGVLHRVSTAGWGTYLATMGHASIRFPAQQTADRCALRLAAEMATAAGTLPEGAELPPLALAGAAALRERLRLNANGAPFETQVTPPAGLEQAAAEEQPALARALVANFLQRRVYEAAFGQVQKTAATLAAELAAELQAELATVRATGNVAILAAWLRQAVETLQGEYAGLLAEANRLAKAAEASQKELETAGAALDQAAGGLFIGRGGRVRGAVGRYLDSAGAFIRVRLEQRIAEAAAEVVYGVLGRARRLAQAADETAQRLAQAQSVLAAREAGLARLTAGRGEINLATDGLVQQLYDRQRPDPAGLLPQLVAGGQEPPADGLLGWSELTAEEVAGRLLAAAAGPFEPIRQITVEDVLAQQWDDRSAQQWIGRLADLAAGAWNLELARLPDGGAALASFFTVGVPDATESIFANCGHTLVSTHDPERIVALRTVYGASYDTLKGADEWQRACEAAGQPLLVEVAGDAVHE